MRVAKSKWFVPLFAVALGFVVFAAQWIGGDPGSGLESLGIMTAFGALILLGGRSETIRGLRGDGRDERFRMIDMHATALAGRRSVQMSTAGSHASDQIGSQLCSRIACAIVAPPTIPKLTKVTAT